MSSSSSSGVKLGGGGGGGGSRQWRFWQLDQSQLMRQVSIMDFSVNSTHIVCSNITSDAAAVESDAGVAVGGFDSFATVFRIKIRAQITTAIAQGCQIDILLFLFTGF